MNYFSHYFFDHQPDDIYHNVGLILPDFSRSAKGKRKLHTEKADLLNDQFRSLAEGCDKHYAADDWFHDSDFFNELQKGIAALIKERAELFKDQRPWFLSHILAELLLDRLLMKRDISVLDRFYADLESANLHVIESFLLQCGKSSFGNFEHFYNTFCEVKYLYYYRDNERLIYSLNRIVQRTGQRPLSDASSSYLSSHVNELELLASEIKKPRQMARLYMF